MLTTKTINKILLDHRLSYIDSQPECAPAPREVWRTVKGTGYTLQVSNLFNMRSTTLAKILAKKKGKDLTVGNDFDSLVDLCDMVFEAFPTMRMKRCS